MTSLASVTICPTAKPWAYFLFGSRFTLDTSHSVPFFAHINHNCLDQVRTCAHKFVKRLNRPSTQPTGSRLTKNLLVLPGDFLKRSTFQEPGLKQVFLTIQISRCRSPNKVYKAICTTGRQRGREKVNNLFLCRFYN